MKTSNLNHSAIFFYGSFAKADGSASTSDGDPNGGTANGGPSATDVTTDRDVG